MWRTKAVRHMLLDAVAEIRNGDDGGAEGLRRAIRRARLVVSVDLVAIAVLVATHPIEPPIFAARPGLDLIFAVGLLAVAAHAGYRFAESRKLAAVARLLAELAERDPEGGSPR